MYVYFTCYYINCFVRCVRDRSPTLVYLWRGPNKRAVSIDGRNHKKENDRQTLLTFETSKQGSPAGKISHSKCWRHPRTNEQFECISPVSIWDNLSIKSNLRNVPGTSRHLSVPRDLYRYKRLLFGSNSAPEMHQRIIQQLLQDIPNCRNIADYIIIHTYTRKYLRKYWHGLSMYLKLADSIKIILNYLF